MVYIQKRVFVVHVACKATLSSINFGVNAYINTGTGSNPGRRLIPQNLRLNAVLKLFLRKLPRLGELNSKHVLLSSNILPLLCRNPWMRY